MSASQFHVETWGPRDCADIPAGHSVRVSFHYDNGCMGYPWKEHDGHGSIRQVSTRYGRPEKRPGERVIHSDRGEWWLYDVQGAIRTARADGWGLADDALAALRAKLGRAPTPGEIAAASVERDIDYCTGWLTGRYFWCGVVATVFDREEVEVSSDSLCGVEWDEYGPNDYATKETAHDVVYQALHASGLTEKQRRAEWRGALAEARARKYWASRDVVTVQG